MKHSNKKSINALFAAASLLPAIHAQAEAPTESKISYRFSQYTEAEISATESNLDQEEERYTIDVHQIGFVAPLNDRSSINLSLQHETLSGASPWLNAAPANAGGPAQAVMSGASIEEERTDYAIRYARHGENLSAGFSYGSSIENDYEASYFGADFEWQLNQKNTTFKFSFSNSDDTLEPTYGDSSALLNTNNLIPVFNDNPSENDPDYCTNNNTGLEQYCRVGNKKEAFTYYFGISQVLSQTTLVLFSYGRTDLEGFLSDPYKLGDSRPDVKDQIVTRVGLRQYFPDLGGGFHFDFRHYEDNWNVESSTIKLAWAQHIGQLLLVPSLRIYKQTAAFFYQPYLGFDPAPSTVFFSNDARLSPFDALSFKLKSLYTTDTVDYHLSFEIYEADDDLNDPASGNIANPGLIEFTRFTVGFDYKF